MTELSPLGTLAKLNWAQSQRPLDAQRKLLEKQGRVICGVDMRIVGETATNCRGTASRSANCRCAARG